MLTDGGTFLADTDDVEPLFAEASARFAARDPLGAAALLRLALVAAPDHARSLALAGLIAGRAGREAECVALLEQAVACGTRAESAAAGLWLAAAHRRAGRPADEIAALELALALDVASDAARGALAAALNAQGLARKHAGDLGGAAASLERAAALAPDAVDPLLNLAGVRKDEGRTEEAVAMLRGVVARAPDLAEARVALAMAHLPALARDAAEPDRRRADYAAELAALEAHAARVGPATLAPGVGAAQPFQLAYLGVDIIDLQRRYGALVSRALTAAHPPAPLAGPPGPRERVRVGIVCGYIRDHSVWRLPTRGWTRGLDRGRFELVAFHTGAVRDAETERATALFDRFEQGPLPLAAWRERIVAARPHVLIYPEIGMDPMAAQLAALRLAPTQYASWGHPVTTGYPTIDAYLSSEAMEPPGAEAHYTERLVRLPGLSSPFVVPPLTTPIPPRVALGLPEDGVLFWCCQSLYKYLPSDDDVFPVIAARCPAARFVFFEYPSSPPLTRRFRERIAAAFAARGLDAEQHCVMLPAMSAPAFRAAMGCADVMLDSIGWSGCNSVLDAFAHALPVVTLPGATMRSRHTAAMLGEMGLERLVCATKADYVDSAAALAADPATRAEFRQAIRTGLPRLNQVSAIPALERELIAVTTDARGAKPWAP